MTAVNRELLIRMEMPIPSGMMFIRWFPWLEDEFISIHEDNIYLKLWFDTSCFDDPGGVGGIPEQVRDKLAGLSNIEAVKINADITVVNLSDQLMDFMKTRGPSGTLPLKEHQPLQEEYEKLAERVYLFSLRRLNRLLAYTRTQLGQYWLEEYSINPNEMLSNFRKFKAKAKVDETGWFRWYSTERPQILTVGPMNLDRYFDKDKWDRAREFVGLSIGTNLILELLAGAERLARIGHTRSALSEAITALEVAIHEFARNSRAGNIFDPLLANRMGIDSLKNQINHLGLSGTVNYLFPVLFSEEQMPTEILKTCQEAIFQRQNVVHQGQRGVNPQKLALYLASVRKICLILDTIQEECM
jgi:hypothetical protein